MRLVVAVSTCAWVESGLVLTATAALYTVIIAAQLAGV
ncbi:MAG: hypothetical protein BWY37_01168 [Firmicutes bacterium ADurb.Bin262]|nr:MAG: hypothetical protein BWY37_01168 [Firmicutes bacterium ADurb.Bin262]